MYPIKIIGIGQINSALDVMNIHGSTKLVVSPVAAIGTDALLITAGTSLFLTSKPTLLKVVGSIAGAWGILALLLEISKLARGPSEVLTTAPKI